ncbi:hypothetical protein S40285_07210 [Stachybotrys chlorohalonatus IBT 40285]|uniref:HpcH/HpaI aldolase/citrate lyase domain-containing protein n=1 Tax=Stachybotrys chlorohalonatus (strain IBT 40285) TaxID=1283841 RepID=A0A084QWF9_STAC4|nr:hypothetical protein S40285_07210 [Stachybotrys chlorohalonata IBT 40285]
MAANALAKSLKALHCPSTPLILANVWDLASLHTLISINADSDVKPVKAVATASWAIAATLGISDEELRPEQNLDAISKIAPACREANLPLSVDLQDGYGDQIVAVVTAAVQAGAVGANIEDVRSPYGQRPDSVTGSFYPIHDQVQRLKLAQTAAAAAGCPDFVINARCDIFSPSQHSPAGDAAKMAEAIARGRAYLDAGATTVFYWGAGRGLRDAEVRALVAELDGRVAVKLASGPAALTTAELAEIGVARVSVGPSIFRIAMAAAKRAALDILGGGRLSS